MSNNSAFPSLTALLGLVAVAGYQNRDKLAEWFGGGQQGDRPKDAPEGFDKIVGQGVGTATAGGLGGLLGGGIQDLIERFKQGGRGETADSWVRQGPNQPVTDRDLEQAIGPDVLSDLVDRTGLSREELLSRLAKRLPDAIDQYTPDGRVTA